MTKLAERTDIPVLPGWLNFTEAAELLGYTRSYMYKKASTPVEKGGFATVHRIGSQASYVISEKEVHSIIDNQAAPAVAVVEAPQEDDVKELSLTDIMAQIP